MAKADDPLIGAKIDRYQVERQIGAGGMGKVYLARQPEIGARVAIKVVNAVDAEERDEWTRRLFAEARAVNLIGHENIVNVLDMVRLSDGRPALVMEYLNGVSLDRLIHESERPLPLGMVSDVVIDVLSAVGAAHRAGILHRDLKPANVFVTPEGRAKVLDFGIAKPVSDRTFRRGLQTQAGKVLGTAVYMAPEQARGQKIDERADLFAVGLILYEAATRRRAIRGPTLGQVLEQQDEPIVPASEYRAEVTAELDAVIMKALQKRPEDRYKSAGAMAAAVRSASPAMARVGRSELTAALVATGRIEIQPSDLRPVVKTPLPSSESPSKESTAPYEGGSKGSKGSEAEEEESIDRGAPVEVDDRSGSAGILRTVLAVGLGAAAAAIAVLLIVRSDASMPIDVAVGAGVDAGARSSVDGGVAEVLVAQVKSGRELAEARRLARKVLPDAELAGLEVDGAFTDQGIRLERVRLRLLSELRKAVGERPCAVVAKAMDGQMVAEVDRTADCKHDVVLPSPRCGAQEILARGWLRIGERAADRVSLDYQGNEWELSIGDRFWTVADECEGMGSGSGSGLSPASQLE